MTIQVDTSDGPKLISVDRFGDNETWRVWGDSGASFSDGSPTFDRLDMHGPAQGEEHGAGEAYHSMHAKGWL